MNNPYIILLALALLATSAFAAPVYDQLKISVVDSADLGVVAGYNENLTSNTTCGGDSASIRGEKLIKLKASYLDSLEVLGIGNLTKFYYRTHMNQRLQNGTNVSGGIVYVKPQDANCYYWARASTEGEDGFDNFWAAKYSPQGRNFGRIDFNHGYPSQNKTTISVRESGNVNGIIKSGFEFEVVGRSNRQNLALQARDGDNTDRIYYWEVVAGNGYRRNGLYNAPLTSFRGSRFLSLTSDETVFDMFLYNRGGGGRPLPPREKD